MKENMYDNFGKLESRVLNSISKTDLILIRDIFKSINEPTLVSGVGGSHVVSAFLTKLLSVKNNIICNNITPRDMNYINLNNYKNVISCSYGGDNFGVDVTFNNNLNKYLLSKNKIEGINNINYHVDYSEHSFISLSATLIPMTIVLLYYLDNDISVIKEILSTNINFDLNDKTIYEVLSGYESNTASTFIDSTLTESGIGIPIIHDKYEYCHGRSSLNHHFNNNIIFFNNYKELDKLFEKELPKYYENIIKIDKKYSDDIINDYYFTYVSMLLCKDLAIKHNKDLSNVDYSQIVKKLYKYKGEM